MKQTILVTGGTGFIGSHTTVELQQAGYRVVIVDNLSNSKAEVIDGIEKITGIRPAFEQVDCCDLSALKNVFRKYSDIKGIIHFAASKAVGESVEKPLLYYRNNITSLLNLLELMPEFGVKGIIFSSSCTVYGQPSKENLPVTEQAPIQKALSPYGNTKQINEEIIQDFIHSGANIKAVILRYFNPIGAHPSALIGELPNGICHKEPGRRHIVLLERLNHVVLIRGLHRSLVIDTMQVQLVRCLCDTPHGHIRSQSHDTVRLVRLRCLQYSVLIHR